MAERDRVKALSSTRKRKWTAQEDWTLQASIRAKHDGKLPPASEVHWSRMKNLLPHRTSLQLRERYVHILDPHVDRKRVTKSEILQVLKYQKKYGNKWSKIAAHMPGRTSLLVKNAFYSSLRRFKRQYNRYPSDTEELIDFFRQFVVAKDSKTEHNDTECLTPRSDPAPQTNSFPDSQADYDSNAEHSEDDAPLSGRTEPRQVDPSEHAGSMSAHFFDLRTYAPGVRTVEEVSLETLLGSSTPESPVVSLDDVDEYSFSWDIQSGKPGGLELQRSHSFLSTDSL
eukprot:gb/GECG01015384.1/.p1 GENE.gb/GECG01015384.1/~~gb/GECG01015384.1/.p1  ORF type:complete len:284 (+),score=36.88 gb/GECG01015384.1/:1-852(+)